MLAKSVTEGARFIAELGVIEEGGPILVRFITQVASRFGVVVTQKVTAQTLPVVGALASSRIARVLLSSPDAVVVGCRTITVEVDMDAGRGGRGVHVYETCYRPQQKGPAPHSPQLPRPAGAPVTRGTRVSPSGIMPSEWDGIMMPSPCA